MKNIDEYSKEVFARRDAVIKKKRRTRRAVSVSVSALCIVLLSVIAVRQLGGEKTSNAVGSNFEGKEETYKTEFNDEPTDHHVPNTSEENTNTKNEEPLPPGINLFSYKDDFELYKEEAETEGFANTDIAPVTDKDEAVERAKNELGKEYSEADVAYDKDEDVWRIIFSEGKNIDGDCVSIYLSADGITLMAVYGE